MPEPRPHCGPKLGCGPLTFATIIFFWLWLWVAEFVVHVCVEVMLSLGVFEGEERSGILRFS